MSEPQTRSCDAPPNPPGFHEPSNSFENGMHSLRTRTIFTDESSTSEINAPGSDELNLPPSVSRIRPLPSNEILFLDQHIAPIVIAIVASLLIYLNFGFLVSNSLVFPFIIWEIHRIFSDYQNENSSENNASVLSATLMLCGVEQIAVSKYFYLISVFKQVSEDFALYLFTVVLWQLIIGYPSFATGQDHSTIDV